MLRPYELDFYFAPFELFAVNYPIPIFPLRTLRSLRLTIPNPTPNLCALCG